MRVRFRTELRYWREKEGKGEDVDWDALGLPRPDGNKEEYDDLKTFVELDTMDIVRSNPASDNSKTAIFLRNGERIIIDHSFEDYCRVFGVVDFDRALINAREYDKNHRISESTDLPTAG